MQFKDMTKAELLEVCDEFGVEGEGSKALILARLFEDGVTEGMYLKAHPELAEDYVEPEKVELPTQETTVKPKTAPKKVNQVLVLMQRANPTYEYNGYRFTREHPFALVNEDDIDDLFENNEGFRQATPKEAAQYYS